MKNHSSEEDNDDELALLTKNFKKNLKESEQVIEIWFFIP